MMNSFSVFKIFTALSALQGHLGWDQEVLMPAKGASSRGEMMAWLAGKRHEQVDGPTNG